MKQYEQHVTQAWQHSQEIRQRFNRLKAIGDYEDLIVDRLALKWQVDAGTIRAILEQTEKENEIHGRGNEE